MITVKTRRNVNQKEPKLKKGAKKQLIVMLIAVALMVFSVVQVYYMIRFTLGYNIEENHLKVYKWVSLLLQ